MKDNREKWQFYNHPSKPALKYSEVRYWKELMKKLLKVGLELEFNLLDQKGYCKGDNIQCHCIHIDEGCWKECQNYEKCETVPCYDTCANKKKSCKPEDCITCDNYKLLCLGTSCVDFVSKCFACTRFEKNCDTCPNKYDPKKDPKNIRKMLTSEFQPTNHYENVGPSGVVGVTTDGSLLGDHGVEIITVGRRVDFWEFYQMSKKIIDKVVDSGGYLNERCGAHAHLLASYYADTGVNEMEKEMPEIILANFHQLCRRYQNAITWMTMALDNPLHMTRWEKFRVSVLGVSPVMKDMRAVVNEVITNSGGNKYGWVSYNRVKFGKENNINTFHVEMRAADATLCPSAWAAIACMYYSLVIKAVEISRYGLLKVGEEDWLKKASKMKKAILNGCGDYRDSNRLSNTEKVLDYKDAYVEESHDMLAQLKGILFKLGPAYDILSKLADKPIALRRIGGESWVDIEKDLETKITEADQIELKLNEIIDLRLIEDCKSVGEWVVEVNKSMTEDEEFDQEVNEEDIELYINGKLREGEVIWSESTGSMITL